MTKSKPEIEEIIDEIVEKERELKKMIDVILPNDPIGLENHSIKDSQITGLIRIFDQSEGGIRPLDQSEIRTLILKATGSHQEGQITCYSYYARLKTDKCWIADQPVRTQP